MKTQDILLAAGAVGLAFVGYKLYKDAQAPAVPAPPAGSNPYQPGSTQAQNWLAWFTALVASGLSVTEAILKAREKTDAGATPPTKDGKVGCATCNLPYSIGCSAGCACEKLQPGEMPTIL